MLRGLHVAGDFILMFVLAAAANDGQAGPQLSIHWDKPVVVSKSIPTLQVVVNPPLRPGEPSAPRLTKQ